MSAVLAIVIRWRCSTVRRLPSPEPLKRVVPLDLFPTSVIASSLVQKTYSPNFPGEFGGGVINLTTKAIPRENFLTIGGDIGVNGETTNQLGYTYYGSSQDWSGFDNGNRDLQPALARLFARGKCRSAPAMSIPRPLPRQLGHWSQCRHPAQPQPSAQWLCHHHRRHQFRHWRRCDDGHHFQCRLQQQMAHARHHPADRVDA